MHKVLRWVYTLVLFDSYKFIIHAHCGEFDNRKSIENNIKLPIIILYRENCW